MEGEKANMVSCPLCLPHERFSFVRPTERPPLHRAPPRHGTVWRAHGSQGSTRDASDLRSGVVTSKAASKPGGLRTREEEQTGGSGGF